MIRIEFEDQVKERCECCGGTTTRLTRFVYKDNDAFAVYYAMFSDNHTEHEIKAAIEYVSVPSKAIQAKHPDDAAADDPRKFLAYVLGKSHTKPGTRNSVLAYQYEGHNTSTEDAKKWRCFKVDELVSLSQITFAPVDPALTIPDPLTPADVARQNCVDIPGGRIVRLVKYQA